MSETTSGDLTLPGLVHDLNNVFETISEAAELVSTDPEWANLAAAIQRSVDRGRRIVGCYAGQSRSGPDLEVAVDRAATFLHDFLPHLPGTKVKLLKKIQAGLRVQGDSGDWERVFMNLFLNAAQAMKESGGGEIEVVSQLRDSMVEMSVADSGPGIPESILAKIFHPRFSTKTKQAGLGLHIVHTIVQQNGGVVKAGNRDGGRGAVFTILAPAAEPD
ncbi:MAG: HAMP domain-containing histidine kinase [Candidatus Solibacter usitatus]|nr:HAMP domain-containing histidine kinase [Candidatus Solibacter usitatus]